MRDANGTRPLIEVAREKMREAVRLDIETDHELAWMFVAGYEAGEASVHRDGVRDYSGALAMANARIAELEAQLAEMSASRQAILSSIGASAMREKDARITELEAQLAASETCGDDRTVGVVVTDEMAIAALNEYWRIENQKLTSRELELWRRILTAALRTARTVPLASGEPVWWRDDGYKPGTMLGLCSSRGLAAEHNDGTVTPLYAGLAEPAQRGEG